MSFENKENAGVIHLKSYTELHTTLVQEVLKREQHRLNYEKLKALNSKLQLELQQSAGGKKSPEEEYDQDINAELGDGKGEEDCSDENEIEFPEYNPYHRLLLGIPDVQSEKNCKECSANPQLLSTDSKQSLLDQGLQSLEDLLRKKFYDENPSERQKFGFWESTEMLSTLGRWKRDYTALYQEFQNYQEAIRATVESEVSAVNEKITLLEEESQRTRAELEKEKFDLDSTCRELIREKSSLRTEIRTVREELDETRLKLEEKSTEYETLSRKMDGMINNTFSQLKGDCQDRSHVALNSRLNAAESRTGFLEHEIQELIKGKETLLQEMNEMTRRHERKVEQLNKHIEHLEHLFSQERKDFEVKYNDLKRMVETQQAYIAEMEETMKTKEEENEALIAEVHDQMKYFMEDALNAITTMGEEKSATCTNQEKLTEEIAVIQSHVNNLKEEVKTHQHFSIDLCNQALVLLNTSDLTTSNIMLPKVQKIRANDSNAGELVNHIGLEEETLKKLIEAVVNAKEKFRNHEDRLQSRIQELEIRLKKDKVQYSTEIETSQKKCKIYSRLIRKLRKRLEHPQTHPSRADVNSKLSIIEDKQKQLQQEYEDDLTTTKESHESGTEITKLNYLRQTHSQFLEILTKLDKDEKFESPITFH